MAYWAYNTIELTFEVKASASHIKPRTYSDILNVEGRHGWELVSIVDVGPVDQPNLLAFMMKQAD